MAYVLDNEPVPGIGTSMNTGGPNLGLGALGTGLLLAYVGFTGADAFLVLVLALGCTAVAIAVSPETMAPRTGVLHALKPQLVIPKTVRPCLLPVTCIAVAGRSMGGFYQAYSAVLTTTVFHVQSPLMAALFCFSFIGPIVIGAAMARTWSARQAQWRGSSCS